MGFIQDLFGGTDDSVQQTTNTSIVETNIGLQSSDLLALGRIFGSQPAMVERLSAGVQSFPTAAGSPGKQPGALQGRSGPAGGLDVNRLLFVAVVGIAAFTLFFK